MTSKLIIIEGLPGSGKSTYASWAGEILAGQGMKANLFTEGNPDHPADYDGVACYSEAEYLRLLGDMEAYRPILENHSERRGEYRFIPYRKLKEAYAPDFPDELVGILMQTDVYELPFERNAEVIAEKWSHFADQAAAQDGIYIFECCFIQNPLTVGLVKYNVPQTDVLEYVKRLEQSVLKLEPVLIYIDQDDVERSFLKAVAERPREWADGFIDYYTNQGYGLSRGLTGIEGTIEVLRHKRKLAGEIMGRLQIPTKVINNTAFDPVRGRSELQGILESLIVTGG
ncbi:hypothetical protein V3851_05705 [Paenibacillus sp. M1]|uniref:Thymidylate kinase n=1 Tax=Paenibacillus haidiansis TaxID=1574488 RepID=A0ABU7VNK2_9BACL